MKAVPANLLPNVGDTDMFTEITIKSTPEIIAQATASAIEADRLVWVSELKPMRGNDMRCELRMILRNK